MLSQYAFSNQRPHSTQQVKLGQLLHHQVANDHNYESARHNGIMAGHYEPRVIDWPMTMHVRPTATVKTMIDQSFQVPPSSVLPGATNSVMFVFVWNSPSNILKIFLQNSDNGEYYYYDSPQTSDPPVSLANFQQSQLSAAKYDIWGSTASFNQNYQYGLFHGAKLTQVPPELCSLTTTDLNRWKSNSAAEVVTTGVNNGLCALAPLLIQPEYVARYNSPDDPASELIPSLVTTKSSQTLNFYHRTQPDLFDVPNGSTTVHTLFSVGQDQLALFTRQLGIYKISFRFTFKCDSAPVALTILSGQNIIDRDNGLFLDTIKIPLPNPQFVDVNNQGYATVEDHYTFECQSPQKSLEIRVSVNSGFSFTTGQVQLTSVSSASDDISQPATVLMCVDPSDEMRFQIQGIEAYNYVPGPKAQNLVSTMTANTMVDDHIEQTYNFIQNLTEATGCYDVFPRHEYEAINAEVGLAAAPGKQLMYANTFFKKMKHGVKKATGFATKVAAPFVNTMVPAEFQAPVNMMVDKASNWASACNDLAFIQAQPLPLPPPVDVHTESSAVEYVMESKKNPGPGPTLWEALCAQLSCCGSREVEFNVQCSNNGCSVSATPKEPTLNLFPDDEPDSSAQPHDADTGHASVVPMMLGPQIPEVPRPDVANASVNLSHQLIGSLQLDQAQPGPSEFPHLPDSFIIKAEPKLVSCYTGTDGTLPTVHVSPDHDEWEPILAELRPVETEEVKESRPAHEFSELDSGYGHTVATAENVLVEPSLSFIQNRQPVLDQNEEVRHAIEQIDFGSLGLASKPGINSRIAFSMNDFAGFETLADQLYPPTQRVAAVVESVYVEPYQGCTRSERLIGSPGKFTERYFPIVGSTQTGVQATLVALRVSIGKVPGLDKYNASVVRVKDTVIRFINFDWESEAGSSGLQPAVAERLLESIVDITQMKLGGQAPIINIHLDQKREFDGQISGMSWMLAYYACVANFPSQFAYTGSFYYREGFLPIGVMTGQLSALVSKIVATAVANLDLVVMASDTNDAAKWTSITTELASALQQRGSDLKIERVNILDYHRDPKICKILTPAYPAALLENKNFTKLGGGNENVDKDIRAAFLNALDGYEAKTGKMNQTLRKMFSERSLEELKPLLPIQWGQQYYTAMRERLGKDRKSDVPWVTATDADQFFGSIPGATELMRKVRNKRNNVDYDLVAIKNILEGTHTMDTNNEAWNAFHNHPLISKFAGQAARIRRTQAQAPAQQVTQPVPVPQPPQLPPQPLLQPPPTVTQSVESVVEQTPKSGIQKLDADTFQIYEGPAKFDLSRTSTLRQMYDQALNAGYDDLGTAEMIAEAGKDPVPSTPDWVVNALKALEFIYHSEAQDPASTNAEFDRLVQRAEEQYLAPAMRTAVPPERMARAPRQTQPPTQQPAPVVQQVAQPQQPSLQSKEQEYLKQIGFSYNGKPDAMTTNMEKLYNAMKYTDLSIKDQLESVVKSMDAKQIAGVISALNGTLSNFDVNPQWYPSMEKALRTAQKAQSTIQSAADKQLASKTSNPTPQAPIPEVPVQSQSRRPAGRGGIGQMQQRQTTGVAEPVSNFGDVVSGLMNVRL